MFFLTEKKHRTHHPTDSLNEIVLVKRVCLFPLPILKAVIVKKVCLLRWLCGNISVRYTKLTKASPALAKANSDRKTMYASILNAKPCMVENKTTRATPNNMALRRPNRSANFGRKSPPRPAPTKKSAPIMGMNFSRSHERLKVEIKPAPGVI